MRISDWSSDVCSSDLKPLAPIVDRRATCDPQPDAARRARRHCRRPVRDSAEDINDPAHCSSIISVCYGPFVGSRSEEHTSELQSLMRISYAVFCLKKNHTQLELL